MYQQEITIDHLGIYYIYLIDSNVWKLTIAKATKSATSAILIEFKYYEEQT